jgi:hypothetical protein
MKRYLLFPFSPADLQNRIFESPYGVLRDKLKLHNIDLQTYDAGDLPSSDNVLFFNHKPSQLKQCIAAGLPVDKRVLFLFEPEVVLPQQYQPRIWKLYGKIFTLRDDLVDNKKILKMHYPQGQIYLSRVPGFHERKFLTLVNANKYSYVKNELYSFRRLAIRYFEGHGENFDLFGHGWDTKVAFHTSTLLSALRRAAFSQYFRDLKDGSRRYTSYRGTVESKPSTLAQYKFCLAFENEKDVPGYITEKIFDSLFCGTIPIYLGASNIEEYIPSNCFIDMRSFENFAQLERHLTTLSEKDFVALQRAGQEFIHGERMKQWRPEGAFGQIVSQLVI